MPRVEGWARPGAHAARLLHAPPPTAWRLALPAPSRQCACTRVRIKGTRTVATQDVTRFDLFNVRLRLAVFDGADASTRYRLVSLAPGASAAAGAGQQRGVYRGPAVQLLQPGGIATTSGAGTCGDSGGQESGGLPP